MTSKLRGRIIPSSISPAVPLLMLGAVVILCATEEDAGWITPLGRALLALRFTWAILLLLTLIWLPVSRFRRRHQRRWAARQAMSHRAKLLTTLDLMSKRADARGD